MTACRHLFVLTFVLIGLFPHPAFAQLSDTSQWGIGVSFTPAWESEETWRKIFIEGEGELEGKEFTIGIIRGSASGGDWGISFVQKPFKDGLTIVERDEYASDPCTPQNCSSGSTTQTSIMRDVKLTGVEFHWFKPFVTIANRVQIGINIAGGIAAVKGTVDETITFENVNTFNGQTFRSSDSDTFLQPAEEALFRYWPLGKVEAQTAIIVAPAAKIKVSVGMNFPAQIAFRVGGIVFFGSN
jgi:hypothetical protein